MDEIDLRIIVELTKNSKTSDRMLARTFGVSQPTITRRRVRLEKQGLLDYTIIPKLSELRYEIMAFHFVEFHNKQYATVSQEENLQKITRDFIARNPCFIFISTGRGMGMTRMGITVHRTYSEFQKFAQAAQAEWGQYLSRFDYFLVSLKGDQILRNITFKHLLSSLIQPQ